MNTEGLVERVPDDVRKLAYDLSQLWSPTEAGGRDQGIAYEAAIDAVMSDRRSRGNAEEIAKALGPLVARLEGNVVGLRPYIGTTIVVSKEFVDLMARNVRELQHALAALHSEKGENK